MGWCNHPKRRTGDDVRIYVRSNELPCRNDWAIDLWQATGPDASDHVVDAVAEPVAPATAEELNWIVAREHRANAPADQQPASGPGEDIVLGDLTSLVPNSGGVTRDDGRRLRKAHEELRSRNRERREGVAPIADDPLPLRPTGSGLWLADDLASRDVNREGGSNVVERKLRNRGPEIGEVSPVALGELGRPFPKMTTFPEDDVRFSSIPESVVGIDLPMAVRPEPNQQVVHRAGFDDDREIALWNSESRSDTAESTDAPSAGVGFGGPSIAAPGSFARSNSVLIEDAEPWNADPHDQSNPSLSLPIPGAEADQLPLIRSITPESLPDAPDHTEFDYRWTPEHDRTSGRTIDNRRATARRQSQVDDSDVDYGEPGWQTYEAADQIDEPARPLRQMRTRDRAFPGSERVREVDPGEPAYRDSELRSVDFDDSEPFESELDAPERDSWATLPRMCGTCREFRPAENSERGWCTNKRAFTHRRMVDADELPCETSIGRWWLPHDDLWMSSGDISAHSQPTPLLDLWLAHRAASSGEVESSIPSRRRQQS
jgi:hypothetical protein